MIVECVHRETKNSREQSGLPSPTQHSKGERESREKGGGGGGGVTATSQERSQRSCQVRGARSGSGAFWKARQWFSQ